jgi:hypothetical protein
MGPNAASCLSFVNFPSGPRVLHVTGFSKRSPAFNSASAVSKTRNSKDNDDDQPKPILHGPLFCREQSTDSGADTNEPYNQVDLWTAILQEQVHLGILIFHRG